MLGPGESIPIPLNSCDWAMSSMRHADYSHTAYHNGSQYSKISTLGSVVNSFGRYRHIVLTPNSMLNLNRTPLGSVKNAFPGSRSKEKDTRVTVFLKQLCFQGSGYEVDEEITL